MLKQDIERHGDGYYIHRIPGIVCTRRGTVLAYCESRSGGDWSEIDITLRKSTDDGKTWGARRVLVRGEGHTTNNPVMFAGGDSGRIHFLWHKNYACAFYQFSDDEGESWSEPEDVTYAYEQFRPEYPWEVIAAGPGHGTVLSNGTLFVPVWLSTDHSHHPFVCGCIFSHDNGKTWNRGGLIMATDKIPEPNETAACETGDGGILMNIRNTGPSYRRAVAKSADGGASFSAPVLETQLQDPHCAAGMLSFRNEANRHVLVFSNCESESPLRINLSLRVSLDDGANWRALGVIEEISGYSDVCLNPLTGTLFCYYERGWLENKPGWPQALTVARIESFMNDFEAEL
jgi:sialidase-1